MRRLVLAASVLLVAACAASAGSPVTTGPSAVPASSVASSAPSVSSLTSATPVAAPTPSPTAASTAAPTPSSAPSPQAGAIGSGLQVPTTGGGTATVGVVDDRKHAACGGMTPAQGDVYVAVSVGYSADKGPLVISPTDWTITDAAGRVSRVDPTITCEAGTFKPHTLAEAGNDGGWIVFDVAADATDVSLVYSTRAGPVASWRLW